jgi:hypothetical protein
MSVRLAAAIAEPMTGSVSHAPVDELFDGVDDLIKRVADVVADVDSPEILRVRARVHAGLVAAKSAFAGYVSQVREPAAASAEAVAEDVPPADELGIALLVGLGLGLVASLRQ